jgi:cysteinyl-tRNA synthetase
VDDEFDGQAVARFRRQMDDDLDTPGALATVFDLVRRANASADAGDAEGARRTARTAAQLCSVLGLTLRAGAQDTIDEASAELVRRRDEARAERDWARADGLRLELEQSGWLVEDSPEGTRIRRR